MVRWFVDGEEGRAIDAEDRGLAYGDGLFETVAFREGAPRFLDRHLGRLADGCSRLRIPPPDPRGLRTQVEALGRGHARGTIKIIVTRGRGPRGYAPPTPCRPTQLVGFFPVEAAEATPGGGVVTCSVPASANGALAGIKTLNRIDNVLAHAEALSRGASEGIMFCEDGTLVSGTRSNLFLVRAGRLLTPRLDKAGVNGIMRALVIEVAGTLGIPTDICRLGRPDLGVADEVFLTNSLTGIRLVDCIDGRPTGSPRLARGLADALEAFGIRASAP